MVSTEDQEIAGVSRELGGWVPFLRRKATANDTAKSIEVVNECLDRLAERGRTYDAVCLLQPTTPFRSNELLRQALRRFTLGNLTGLISVRRIPDHYHPNWAFVPQDGVLRPAQGPGSVIARRQDLPPAFYRDGAIYITDTATLRSGTFFGEQLGFVENPVAKWVNIDTQEDWDAAERALG